MIPGTLCTYCCIRDAEEMIDGLPVCPECKKDLERDAE